VSNDLTITNRYDESHGYVIAEGEQNPVLHTSNAPNVPLPGSGSSPTQAGGLYDVRDSGSKALAHLDWRLGAGQRSLDGNEANASLFWESSNMDVSRPGELQLLRPVSNTHLENTCGPCFSALGYLWMGNSLGVLSYSADNGANWTACTGYTSTAPISGFATDGVKVFICIPAGASNSVWVNTAAAPGTFSRFGSTGTTAAIRHLAYQSGYLWGATASGAGVFDSDTGVFTEKTQPSINRVNSSVALVVAASAVYWVTSQGGRSYVYQITHSFSGATLTVVTEQYMEMPTGFVATCALGYLSVVYVGGYYQSATTGVGKGAVYLCAEGYAAPLFEIGEHPELTEDPANMSNDNRIWAICSASKDLYVLTNRACYRWDIDGTGYAHTFDFPGCGSSELVTTWTAGSLYSWDGSEAGVPDAPHYQFPEGYTRTTSGAGTAVWDYAGGIAKVSCADGVITTIATGAPTLNNALGTTMAVAFGADCVGWVDPTVDDHCYVGYLRDGARQMKWSYWQMGTYAKACLHTWSGSAWSATYCSPRVTASSGAHTITVTLKGIAATLQMDSGAIISTNSTKATADAAQIVHEMHAQWHSHGHDGTNAVVCAIDSILLNSTGAAASGALTDATFRPSLAHCRGNLMAPYAEASGNKSLTITALSKANPTQITTSAPHGIAAGGTQVVNISGSNSVPSADGNFLATYVDDTKFTVVFNVATTAGTAGTVSYNHATGYSKTTTGVAASGSLTQSLTSFHSGTMLKDFRYVDVSHDLLPAGAGLTMSWEIDGVGGNAIGVTTDTHTTFTIGVRGYAIRTTLGMTRDTTATVSPVVKAVNIIWDFVKTKKHQYLLDCRQGAGGGRWSESSEEAISFLFSTADEQASFEDRFIGSYEGTIEEVQFAQANYSPKEGYGGLVRVTVRET
jgi:hypothetical protein